MFNPIQMIFGTKYDRDQKKLKEEYSNNKHWYEWIDNKERAFESILSLQSEKENKL